MNGSWDVISKSEYATAKLIANNILESNKTVNDCINAMLKGVSDI